MPTATAQIGSWPTPLAHPIQPAARAHILAPSHPPMGRGTVALSREIAPGSGRLQMAQALTVTVTIRRYRYL